MSVGGSSLLAALRRFGPISVIGAGLALVIMSGAYQHMSLQAVSDNYLTWRDLVAVRPLLCGAVFIAAYTIAVSLSLPGTLWISVVGGLLFGWALGAVLSWAGAVSGAIVIFLAASTALRDPLRGLAGGRLAQLKKGVEGDAFLYLLILRFLPLPFFLVNLAPAFLTVRVRDYALSTALGLIPAILAFSAIGAGAGDILAAGEALTPSRVADPKIGVGITLLLALTILALWAKRRRSVLTSGESA